MSNVLPPSLGLAAATARGAPAGVHGTITNPPLGIAQLVTGTILRGQVLRQDTRGHILVRTDLGTLQILSAALIAPGSQVTLQLRTAGSQLHVTILQVEGQPAQGQRPAPVPAIAPAGTGPPAPAQNTAAPPDVLVIGQSLEAVLQAPPKAEKTATARDSAPPPLPTGSRLQLHVLRVHVPGAPGPGPASSVPPVPEAPSGTIALAPGAQLPGLLAGATRSGQPLVQTAVGLLKLSLPTTLPKGTQLVFELEAVTLAARAAETDLVAPRPATLIYSWPALDEALTLLQQLDGTAANQALLAGSNVPRPGARLASTILFFLQALGRGDLNAWLGQQAAEALGRAGRSDLLSRMGQDLAQLNRLSDNAGPEWRFLPFPLFDGSPVQPLRLFVRSRRGRGGEGPEESEEPTRFILEVELSHFGGLQLDGLVRDRRFDLVLRTRKPLSEVMRRDIAVIFGHANELSGTQGQIVFQASPEWSFMPLKQPVAEAAGLVV